MGSPSPAKLSKRTNVGRGPSAGSSGGDGWGMGFLLVFFPQEYHHHHHQNAVDSPPPFKSPTINTLLKRSSSTHLLARAQTTVSICALVVFFTLLMFTLCGFEPNNTSHHHRRHLAQSHGFQAILAKSNSPALQRLGTLYTRGTKPMNDIVICHVPESSSSLSELKSFLRAFHRSGLFSRSDLLFIFPSITTPESSDCVIREENQLFINILHQYRSELSNRSKGSHFPASFDVNQFVKSVKEMNKGEPIWGRRNKSGVNSNSNSSTGDDGELTRLSYGSVVGFGVGELDPENSLSGFVDHVPMGLRRWASYPMILGRIRRSYKHVMLVDVKEVLPLGDSLARVRLGSPDSVYLSFTTHHRKSTDKTVNPAVITGGARGVRRLSAAMLTEIVRQTTHNKRKTPVTESALLSRLSMNEYVQKNIHLVESAELVQEASSLSGVVIAKSNKLVRRGNSNIDIELMKRICSFTIEASVYTECRKVQPF